MWPSQVKVTILIDLFWLIILLQTLKKAYYLGKGVQYLNENVIFFIYTISLR